MLACRFPYQVFVGVLLAVLMTACGDSGAPAQRAAAEVSVVTLRTQTVTLTRELPGRINPIRIAEVRPQVSGIVRERLFAEGGTVAAGDVLYQLDDAIYRADVASAQASLARAEAVLYTAELSAKRADELAASGAISREAHDNATAALREAEAGVKVAQAAVESSRILLDYSGITAPISGRIGRSSVTPGALVTANQEDVLAVIRQLDTVYVDLTQPSVELLQLRRQLADGKLHQADQVAVTLLLEDGSRYPHPGELAFREVSVDPSTGSFLLRATVPNPEQQLLPGMYVRAVIEIGTRPEALLAPQRGVTRDPKGNATALVVGDDGTVEQRSLEISRAIDDQWLVESGLAPGDRVIVSGLQRIRPGMPVSVSEADSDTPAPVGAAHAAAHAADGRGSQ